MYIRGLGSDLSPRFSRLEYQDLGVLWKAWASKGKDVELSQKQDRVKDSKWDDSYKQTDVECDDTIEFKRKNE